MNSHELPLSIQLTNKHRQADVVQANSVASRAKQACVNVILVEDDEVDSEIVRRSLNSFDPEGYKIRQVSSLSEAIRTITKFDYDIILLDLGLKDCSSLDAVGSLVSIVTAPIVVLSGNEDREVAFKALQFGAQDFLSKSENLRLLLPKTIHFAIERYLTKNDLVRSDELQARQAEWEQRSNSRLRSRLAESEARAALAECTNQSVAILDANEVNWVNQALKKTLPIEQQPATITDAFPDLPAVTVLEIEQAIHDRQPFRHAWLADQIDGCSILKRVELLPIQPGSTGQFILTMSTDRVAVC